MVLGLVAGHLGADERRVCGQRLMAAGHRDHARPDHLDDAVGAEHELEFADLLRRAGDLDHKRLVVHVHHAGAEDIDELQHLRARVGRDGDLDLPEFPHEGGLAREVINAEHVDPLVEICLDQPGAGLGRLDDDGET